MRPRWKGKGAQAKALANPMSKIVSTLQSSLIQSDCQGTLSGNNILIGAHTEQIDLFNNAYFGRFTISDEKDKHQLLLTMEEAFYLHFSLNCLKILVGENNCNQPEDKLWKYMTSRTEKFPDTFKAYSHLRNKNWVVRNGAQYGVDFVAYRHHPSLVHSEYAVLVLSDSNGDENDRLRVWSDYECTLRLCGVVVKTLLVLYINRNGRGADSQSCLEGYTVEERTITRWSPEQCREDKVKVKGALDGGLDIHHSDKRFAGFDKEGKSLDADTHRKYIYGGHVAEYSLRPISLETLETLAEDEPEKYQTHFSDYIKTGVEADGIEEVYKKAHSAIRADPTLKKSEKQPPKEHKRYGFVLRIVLLLLVAWMTLLILNSAIVVVPISLGRALFNAVPLLPITHGIKCNDIYAFVIGSYFIWTALAGVRYSIDQIKTRRARVLLGQIWKWFGIVMKSSALLSIWIFVIPVLIGLLFELLIIVPMRVPVDESPVFLLYQEWAFGLIFLKVWTRLVMLDHMLPLIDDSWRVKFERVREDGFSRLQGFWVLREIVIPIIMKLLTALCVPYVLARGVFPVFGYPLIVNSAVYRFAWIGCLGFSLFCYCAKRFHVWFTNLHNSIRDDRYLIGRRLHNFGEDRQNGTEEEMQSSSSIGDSLIRNDGDVDVGLRQRRAIPIEG